MQGGGTYVARRQYPERNQFYGSQASIFPVHLDKERRFDSEQRAAFTEFNPSRPEERTDCKYLRSIFSNLVVIEDGMMVNPYLKRRAKGK